MAASLLVFNIGLFLVQVYTDTGFRHTNNCQASSALSNAVIANAAGLIVSADEENAPPRAIK